MKTDQSIPHKIKQKFVGTLFEEEEISAKQNFYTQKAKDNKGHKRWTGAFTGGFVAGYNNTVGSKEGWKPSTFISSKNNRGAVKEYSVLDLMDEEDLQETELNKNLLQKRGFNTFGKLADAQALNQDSLELRLKSFGNKIYENIISESVDDQKKKNKTQSVTELQGYLRALESSKAIKSGQSFLGLGCKPNQQKSGPSLAQFQMKPLASTEKKSKIFMNVKKNEYEDVVDEDDTFTINNIGNTVEYNYMANDDLTLQSKTQVRDIKEQSRQRVIVCQAETLIPENKWSFAYEIPEDFNFYYENGEEKSKKQMNEQTEESRQRFLETLKSKNKELFDLGSRFVTQSEQAISENPETDTAGYGLVNAENQSDLAEKPSQLRQNQIDSKEEPKKISLVDTVNSKPLSVRRSVEKWDVSPILAERFGYAKTTPKSSIEEIQNQLRETLKAAEATQNYKEEALLDINSEIIPSGKDDLYREVFN